MGLNMNKLKDIQADLNTRAGDTNKYLQTKALKAESDIRILPTLPNMGETYFIERTVFWINKKPYVSPSSFGHPCPIQEEIDAATEFSNSPEGGKDEELKTLLASEALSKRVTYLIPILLLDCEFDGSNNPTKVKVVDECAKIFEVGIQLMKAINRVVTGRTVQNGTEWGIIDRVKGRNILILKEGTGKATQYNAQPWDASYEMPEKWYEEKNILDLKKEVENSIDDDDYLRSVIRNYLWGEAVLTKKPKPKAAASSATVEKKETATTRTGAAKAETTTRRAAAPVAETSKRSAPAPATRRAAAVVEEQEVIEEEEQEESEQVEEKAPPATTRAARIVAPATRRTTPAPVATTRGGASAGAGKRSLLDDVSNLGDD